MKNRVQHGHAEPQVLTKPVVVLLAHVATGAALVAAQLLALSGIEGCSDSETLPLPGRGGSAAGFGGSGMGGTGIGGAILEPCVNLECQQVACPGQGTTSVSGTVRSPALVDPDPLANVVVYVPNALVQPFDPGVACLKCDDQLSGEPLVRAISQADGTFVLPDMPVGQNIPLVVQSGRWRRQITIPNVAECVDTPLPADLTHLPQSQSEGDIPLMALQTGYMDALECMLAKLLDPAELTSPTGGGRVHLYFGNGNNTSPPLPSSSTLWSDLSTLSAYDVVLMPCEGAAPAGIPLPADAVANLRDYTNLGGRLLLTHGGGRWVHDASPAPFPDVIHFDMQPDPPSPLAALVDTSFTTACVQPDPQPPS